MLTAPLRNKEIQKGKNGREKGPARAASKNEKWAIKSAGWKDNRAETPGNPSKCHCHLPHHRQTFMREIESGGEGNWAGPKWKCTYIHLEASFKGLWGAPFILTGPNQRPMSQI